MSTGLSSESANWVLPSYPTTVTPTVPSYEEAVPFRVNHDGVKNYLRNRGTLNIGEWAIEGRRASTSTMSATPNPDLQQQSMQQTQPKVIGADALRNYNRSRSSTPNLIYGPLEPPNSHHHLRVRKEGLANYERNHNSEMKGLLQNYGKLPQPAQPVPHTQGEVATNLFYTHQEGQMGPILNGYARSAPSPRPVVHVKGEAAENNWRKGQGESQLLDHRIDPRVPTPEPHIKGHQAQMNYDMGQGRHVDELFHQYGKLPQSARSAPKVKFDGVQNMLKGQGDAMRKALAQCPPTSRAMERPPSAPMWP